MKILMCNSFFYLRGGAERCFFDLSALLEANGHEVIPFCMKHERNFSSSYSDYFISQIDFPSLLQKGTGLGGKLKVAERVIYSREARQQIEKLIEDTGPDIAHVHGIAHEISPSILPAIRHFGIPIVQTLHDYKLLCPNTSFITNGEVCERCKGYRYYNAVKYRCKRGSLPASLLSSVEMYVHKILQIYEKNVDLFISPSKFLHAKVIEHGIKNKVVQIPNFIEIDSFESCYEPSDYFVYFGRLVGIKGVDTLFEAMREIKQSHLHVIGDGELDDALKKYAQRHDITNVTFHGHLSKEKLLPIIQKALFTIVPSKWYENYPMTVLESLASGTPIIGSNIGGIAEIVSDGEIGLLFEPGNASQLAEKIQFLLKHPQRAIEMGREGRHQVEKFNNPNYHYQKTIEVYEDCKRSVGKKRGNIRVDRQ